MAKLNGGDKLGEQGGEINIQDLLLKDQKESVVGKKLLDQTTRRVIVLVLAMLFSVPVFSVSTYLSEPNSFSYGLTLIKELGPENDGGRQAFNDTVKLQSQLDTPLIKLYVDDKRKGGQLLIWQNYDVDVLSLRDDEKEIVSLDSPDLSENEIYLAVYDLSQQVKIQAILGICTTILVCIVLGTGAMFFSKLTTDLVISPIEDMVTRVNNITADPLKAAHEEEERLLYEELADKEAGINNE